jgi:hypothetical protein
MVHLGETRIMEVMAWAVVLNLVAQAALGREAKLMIYPQKMSTEADKSSLLPPSASLTEGDAVPLYDKALQALPGKASDDQVRQYLKMPVDQLPGDQVEQALKPYIESFKYAVQAVKCRECNWPAWRPETALAKVNEYRRLAFAIRLWARLEITQGECEGAMLPIQTGLGLARHLGQAPLLIQLQMAVAAANSICGEIEQLVQRDDSPNLYSSLAHLPRPFVNPEKAIDAERQATFARFSGTLVSKGQLESQMKPVHDRTRALAKKLDSDLAMLQCVEAIRSYAASHGGQLPQTLAEIKEVSIPNDPMSGAAFRYTRTGATAVLESTVPAGGEKRDELRYEITVKK